MKQAAHRSVFFLLFSFLLVPLLDASVTPVNPQPGENIWHITAGIGTELDQISQIVINNGNAAAACCSGTFTALQKVDNDILTVSSKLDACCATLSSKIDSIVCTSSGSTSATCDFSTIFTALQKVDNDVLTVSSKIDACCFTLNSKIDRLSTATTSATCDFSTVFTAINALSNLVINDFNGTFTALNACCTTLNSKIDSLTTIVNLDFNGTFTALNALNNLIVNDFNGTFTALNALNNLITNDSNGTFTALNALSNLITNDFNGTFTALNALSNLITNDFNGTFSVLAQGFACGGTPLYQSNFSGGTLSLTSTGATYCFAQNLTGAIIVSGPEIGVDLAMHNLIGTFSVIGSDATIHNGNILPAVPSTVADVLTAGIFISSAASGSLIKDCRIECTATALTGTNGRNAIDNAGSNTIITDCYINAGTGGSAGAGIQSGSGGIGINNTGSNVLIKNSKIQLSNGTGTLSFLYAARSTGSVVPVNLSNNAIGSAITTGTTPLAIAITPNGRTAYVANNGAGTVSAIDLSTGTVVATITVGSNPFAIAITPNGRTAYVTNSGSNNVTPIDIATNTTRTAIPVGTLPRGIAITTDGASAYVVNTTSGNITQIDIASETAVSNFGVLGGVATGIAMTPDGTKAYVSTSSAVYPVTLATNTLGTGIPLTNAAGEGIAITPDGTKAYVVNANSNASITPITIATNTAGTPISLGVTTPHAIAISSDGSTAYVGGTSVISIVNLATGTVTGTIGVGNIVAAYGLALVSYSGGSGGAGILQQANYGRIASMVVAGGIGSGTAGDGIVVSSAARSNVIDQCTVLNANNGFKMNGTNDVWIADCIAQTCITDGFVVTNSATSIAVDHCTAMLNGNDGFDFAAAGACCSVGDSSAISNTVYGFVGTGTNVFFYNNFANCNGTNFDSASASSAISGKLDSKIDALSNAITSFSSSFTGCCTTLNSKLDIINTINFPQTNAFIALVDNDVAAISSQLNTVQSQVSALSQVCSWTGPVSPAPVATLFWGNQLNTVAWNRIGNQVAIGGSTVSNPTNSIAVYGVSGSNMFPLAATGLNTSSVTNSLDWSYDGQYIAAAVHREGANLYSAAIYNAQSLVQVANVATGNIFDGSSIGWQPGDNFLALTDQGGNLYILSFDGNRTLSVITQASPSGTGNAYLSWSPTGQYLAVVRGTTLSIYSYSGGNSVSLLQTSAVSAGSLNAVHWSSNSTYIATGDSAGVARVHTYNAGTNTISTVASQTLTQQVRSVRWSAQANTLAVGIDQDASNNDLYVYAFVPNTLTLVSALQPQIGGSVFGLSWTPSLASCQQYLATAGSASGSNPNVTIYGSSISTTPALSLSGTFTALDACCRTLNSKLDRLAVSFNGTFTSLAALNNLIVNDFNGTFTALNSLNNLIVNDFNGTFTSINALGLCGSTPLSQSNVVNGQLVLSTPGASYCLSQNITGSIFVSAANVAIDLNEYTLQGNIIVNDSFSNCRIQNGIVSPPSPSSNLDATFAAIRIGAANNTLVEDVYVLCTNSTTTGVLAGRDGIRTFGTNTIIQRCFIQSGTGNNGGITVAGGNGGVGISASGPGLQVIDCTILTGAGGNGGLTTIAGTAAGSGGNSGAGIFSIAANTQITNCMIMTGGGGLGGSNTFTGATTNSNGGAGGTAGNGITCTGAQAQITDCSIIAGSGNAGGNSSASAQSFGGQGGAGGNGISITGATSTVTGCYIVGGAGSNSGVSASGFGTGGGNGGVGIVTGSQNGMSIQSCVIRMNGGGNAGLTLATNSNVALGGIGGDGILVQSGMVDSIIGCDIASATSLLNGGGISYATGARGGHGINVSGGQVNLIKDCTISSLGAGGTGSQTNGNATNVIAGAGGNGIEIDAPVGAVRNCTINYTGNGGSATTPGGIVTGTMTGGAGGIGIVVNAAVGVLENCVVYSTGVGGSATGNGVNTNAVGGAGGIGISVSSSAGNMNILENCKVSSMGAGGNASNGGINNNGGAGGIGFYINKASMIMKNCQVCITGQGGTGASTTGAGGIGIQVDTNSSAVELIDCLVERTSTAGNGTFTGHAFQINGSNCLLENCFANTINGDGFRVLSSAGIINIRGCSATFCLANGYNMSTSGAGNVVEKCLASGCKQAGAFGFLSQNNSNTVFLLNEARNNTLNYDTANITAANGSFPPVSITVGGNYGANLMGNGNTN